MELQCHRFEELEVGMSATFERLVTDERLQEFANTTGDFNPLHLDKEYAKGTIFGEQIAHGMFTASLISTIIGTKLPGAGCVYVSQSLQFKAPVKVGDMVDAEVVITEKLPKKRRVVLNTTCRAGDVVVLTGEAVVQVPKHKDD